MASESKPSPSDFMEQARSMLAVNPMIAPQMEQFWKAQDGMLDDAQTFTKAWFERRHDATRSALEIVRKVSGNSADPSGAMQAMVDWQQGSFRRLAEDMQEWVELCSSCAGRMTDAEVEAGKEGAEEVAKRAKSAANTKHSTPV